MKNVENFNVSMFEYFKIRSKQSNTNNSIWSFYFSTISRDQFIKEVENFAGYLQSIGVEKGDNIVICLGNIPNAIVSFYAVNACGAIANIVHPLIPEDGLIEIENKCNPKAYIMFDEFMYKYKFLNNLNKKVIICSAKDYLFKLFAFFYGLYTRKNVKKISLNENFIKYSSIKDYTLKKVDINGNDIAIYMHSSGSTGVPKTAMISNQAYNHLADNTLNLIGGKTEEKDTMLMVLPIFHTFGLGVCVHTFLSGGGRVLLIPLFKPALTSIYSKIAHITYMAGVPNMYKKMLECGFFKGKFLKNIKAAYCGGDRLPEYVKELFNTTFEKSDSTLKISEGYGLTEAGICAVNVMNGYKNAKTVGRPSQGNEFIILDDNYNILKSNEIGNIYIHSNALFNGYLGYNENPFVEINNKEWFKTGDIGYLDEDGYLYFMDRQKRMIKISGMNVYPQEIEDLVNTLDEVDYSCVVRINRDNKVATKLYYVADKKYDSIKVEERIKNIISTHLLKYSLPSEYERLEKIPLNQIGKVDFKILQEKNN